MKTAFNSPHAPAAIGPYSHGVIVDKAFYLSGQLALDQATGTLVEGGVQNQTKKAISNVTAILTDAGYQLSDVFKTTVYLKNMNDFESMNKVYAEYFTENLPARSVVEVARLPKDALVEIEVIAYKG